MRITRIIAIPLIGVLVILGACASPAPATPTTLAPAVTTPTAPAPAAETPTAPAPVATAPAPAAATPAAPTPVTAPAKTPMADGLITYKDLKITPGTVKAGETAKVSVSVTNTGVMTNLPVVLKINGKVVDEQALTCKIDIDCDETKEANFSIKMASSGTYTVSVGDQTAKLVVQ